MLKRCKTTWRRCFPGERQNHNHAGSLKTSHAHSSLNIRQRLRALTAKVKRKVRGKANAYAGYIYLGLTMKERSFQLGQEQCLAHAAQALDVFGHTTLRSLLSEKEVAAISAGLAKFEAGLASR